MLHDTIVYYIMLGYIQLLSFTILRYFIMYHTRALLNRGSYQPYHVILYWIVSSPIAKYAIISYHDVLLKSAYLILYFTFFRKLSYVILDHIVVYYVMICPPCSEAKSGCCQQRSDHAQGQVRARARHLRVP